MKVYAIFRICMFCKKESPIAEIVKQAEAMKENQTKSTEEINTLFDALMQKAFNGELIPASS